VGTFVLLVAIQPSVFGSYLPPVFTVLPPLFSPPQTIISLPVQTVVCKNRLVGTLMMLVAVQLSVSGLYLPPVLKHIKCCLQSSLAPPHTIISLPVQTAV